MKNYETMPDEQLVQFSLKNEDCFYFLIKRYEIKLIRYIKQITIVCQEEAEDICQEIFIKVYRNLNDFDQKLLFSSWIYRIAHNEVINHYRKNKLLSKTISLDIVNSSGNSLASLLYDPLDIHEKYTSKKKAETVRKTLAILPEKYREILVLRYLEDKSYKEIGDILRKPKGSVATLIKRAKSKFKKQAETINLMDKY